MDKLDRLPRGSLFSFSVILFVVCSSFDSLDRIMLNIGLTLLGSSDHESFRWEAAIHNGRIVILGMYYLGEILGFSHAGVERGYWGTMRSRYIR